MPAAPETPRTGRIVCYVTERKALGSVDPTENVLGKIRAAMAAGADWVQLREKDLPARELLELARAAIEMKRDVMTAKQPRVIVNDRLDVALAARVDGVHLGGESPPVREIVRWCRGGNAPREFLVGVSCHSMEDARDAEDDGANYVFFGPVFDTPSKRSFGQPQGVEKLAEICRAVRIPVIAIGGVNEENSAKCVDAGAAGIAAIRLFQEALGLAALKRLVERLHGVV